MQASLRLVMVGKGRSLALVGLESFGDHRLLVVLTRDELRPFNVTKPFDLGRRKMNVVDAPAGGTSTTPGEPAQQFIIADLNIHDNRRKLRIPLILKELIEPLGLRQRPRKTIKDVAASTVRLLHAGSNHVLNQRVWHELAAVHDGLGL